MPARRDKHANAASVLNAVQQTGCELIRLCGVNAERNPDHGHIDRKVLLDVLENTSVLLAILLRHVTDLAGEQGQVEQQHTEDRT